MIVLGISLLRIGDLVLQKPLIEGLRRKHPQCEIHLLINKQFAQVEFLFASLVDKFIYFDREAFQKSCGEKEYNILWGYKHLREFVDELNKHSYDSVYNFTHNRLTAHLMGLIPATHRFGIYSHQGAFYGLTNPWILFFNNYFGRAEAAGFHYTELLAKALEIPLEETPIYWRRPSGKTTVVIQPLTSDEKKNWDLKRFRALADLITQNTSYQVKVLGAPFEKERLLAHFSEFNLHICDFQQAQEILKDAALLITGDTSIKHLAALQEVPILELALGSSQPLQVGAYSNNCLILQSRVVCGPCPHSEKCSQTSHRCGEKMNVTAVYEAARMLLSLDRPAWENFAQKYLDLNVLRTEIRHTMGWTVQCLSVAMKNKFDEIIQAKTMVVEELNRRTELSKGVSDEQRTRKLSGRGVEAP